MVTQVLLGWPNKTQSGIKWDNTLTVWATNQLHWELTLESRLTISSFKHLSLVKKEQHCFLTSRCLAGNWLWGRQCPFGTSAGPLQWRSWLHCSLCPSRCSGTALPGKTPSDCSARSRSALMPHGSAGSGTARWRTHGIPAHNNNVKWQESSLFYFFQQMLKR